MPSLGKKQNGIKQLLWSPLFVLAGVCVVLPVLLLTVKTLPIGSMYWDLYIYFDAANRIFEGQVPNVDFFTPVGPLGYWLFAGALKIFPNAQPLLLVEWSLFIISAPLMGVVVWQVGKASQPVAFGLLLPFLFFAILPFNVREYYILAGSDGFGIYNRQAAILLYILTASLVFVKPQKALIWLAGLSMLALFLIKITGFVVGGAFCLFAFFAGRIAFRSALWAVGIFLLGLIILELMNGVASAYLENIATLYSQNSGHIFTSLASKIVQNFKVVFATVLLMGLYITLDYKNWIGRLKSFFRQPGWQSLSLLVDSHALWLGVALVGGVLYESQNWGSQDMIFIWPVLLAVIANTKLPNVLEKGDFVIKLLAFATIIPVTMIVAERAMRAWAGVVRNQPFAHQHLKTVGAVNLRSNMLRRAKLFKEIYPAHRGAFEAMSDAEVLPSHAIFSQFKYQIGYLMHMDDAIDAMLKIEAEKNLRFENILHLSFTNAFPWLMDRSAPKFVAIGADPFRAMPALTQRVLASVAEVDIALFPTCPVIYTNDYLHKIYTPALKHHKRVKITPCYDGFIHPRLVNAMR